MIFVYSKGGVAPYPMAGLTPDTEAHKRMLHVKPYAPKNKKWKPKKDPNDIIRLRQLRPTIVDLKDNKKLGYPAIAKQFGFTHEQIRHQYRIAKGK